MQEHELTISSEGKTLRAFEAYPTEPGRYPAVVVIHEIWGLDANIRHICRRFAREGYATMAMPSTCIPVV